MTRAFFIVGPTATGKSELAADVAREVGAEIVSADAFQIYRGLDLLTAKPESPTLAKAPHQLIGTVPVTEEMNAEKFRREASRAIDEINSRGRLAIVVGGNGLYVKA
ncbi:MAG TPA: isopentenyl transferase family protein, partial [Terrimicrobiaceae bacterium]|nr:isopentenyl transferase family protein [Terrimicrobiaceae bacterium]